MLTELARAWEKQVAHTDKWSYLSPHDVAAITALVSGASFAAAREREAGLVALAERLRWCGWRPIAEAPRDGTAIEAGDPDSGFVRVVQYASEYGGAWYLLGSADTYYAFDSFKVFRPVPTVPAPPKEGGVGMDQDRQAGGRDVMRRTVQGCPPSPRADNRNRGGEDDKG